jgi:hypothetical protein
MFSQWYQRKVSSGTLYHVVQSLRRYLPPWRQLCIVLQIFRRKLLNQPEEISVEFRGRFDSFVILVTDLYDWLFQWFLLLVFHILHIDSSTEECLWPGWAKGHRKVMNFKWCVVIEFVHLSWAFYFNMVHCHWQHCMCTWVEHYTSTWYIAIGNTACALEHSTSTW